MKTSILYGAIFSTALSLCAAQAADQQTFGQKAEGVAETAKDKTLEAGRAAVDAAKSAAATTADAAKNTASAVADAATPNAPARRIDVKLTNRRIEMPEHMGRGKTAFVVTNTGARKRSFEITGEGIERRFVGSVDPNETKTLHVQLKPGNYSISSPPTERAGVVTHARLRVD